MNGFVHVIVHVFPGRRMLKCDFMYSRAFAGVSIKFVAFPDNSFFIFCLRL